MFKSAGKEDKMDVRTAAQKWNCSESTVRKYCRSGIIPTAEKIGLRNKWQIADDSPKPPMTRHGLCYLIDTIYQLKKGADYQQIVWGYNTQQVKAAYRYLIGALFITAFNVDNMAEELKHAKLTPRGLDLLKREIQENKNGVKFKTALNATLNLGVASVGIDVQVQNTDANNHSK